MAGIVSRRGYFMYAYQSWMEQGKINSDAGRRIPCKRERPVIRLAMKR